MTSSPSFIAVYLATVFALSLLLLGIFLESFLSFPLFPDNVSFVFCFLSNFRHLVCNAKALVEVFESYDKNRRKGGRGSVGYSDIKMMKIAQVPTKKKKEKSPIHVSTKTMQAFQALISCNPFNAWKLLLLLLCKFPRRDPIFGTSLTL